MAQNHGVGLGMKRWRVRGFGVAACVMFCLWAALAGAFQCPDTGQDKFYDDGGEILGCPESGHPWYGQDAMYQGERSYTKLDSAGNDLPDNATSWVMVRDNVTGLIWEVKSDDGTVHDKDNTYTWYDPDPETNMGNPGTYSSSNTHDFITALNAAAFGGRTDWRVPTIKELSTLVHGGKAGAPLIDAAYFPRTMSSVYWSSSSYVNSTYYAWGVHFYYGYVDNYYKSRYYYVRAVSSGQ